jgi:hypothetical protein
MVYFSPQNKSNHKKNGLMLRKQKKIWGHKD